jgi:hypothetical protein
MQSRGISVPTQSLMLAAGLLATSCVGTTGDDLITFSAYAAGPADALAGDAYTFSTGRGYEVALTTARLHIGALYINKSAPSSVTVDTSCTLAGIYVGEVTTGFDVDVLSPALQPFPTPGYGTTETAKTGEVWLMGGDIHDANDPTVILQVGGNATKEGVEYPFEGTLTISQNRVVIPSDPAQPGSKPICKERIVSPIAIDITPQPKGRLIVRINPRGWFHNVEFSELEKATEAPLLYRFKDSSEDQPSENLYGGLRAITGVYTLAWENSNP